jgi:hypothetical protein
MKKKTFLLIAVVCSSFIMLAFNYNTTQLKKKRPSSIIWWDFNGTSAVEMSLNSYYTPDPNNFPDCPLQAGSIYCEIYAAEDPDTYPDTKPDLSTISNYRMKP